MGTRSLTHIKDDNGDTLVTFYRQFDGYPSGHGQELADYCAKRKLVNGYSMGVDTIENAANGMGCLAAQLIAHFKDKIGGIYISPPDDSDSWEEYTYTVYPYGGTSVKIKVTSEYGDEKVFDGRAADYDGEKIEEETF